MAGAYRTSNPHLRKAMLKVFRHKCFYTGQDVSESNMAIDHVVPRSKGGEDSVFNYVLTTRTINGQKRDVLDAERVKSVLYLVENVYAPRVIRILEGNQSGDSGIEIPVTVVGKTLRLYKDFQYNANQDLTDKEFKIYLSMMRRVFFKENTNIPLNGADVIEYSWSVAKSGGVKISKQGFYNIMNSLVEKNYLVKFKLGCYGGKHDATEYRLERF